MREIEFRVWDKIEKRMIYANEAINSKDLLAIGLHGLPISVDRDSFKENEIIGWNRDHNLIPMQYTGLKDKNGVEIYEGDILKVHYIGGNGFENNKVIYDRGAYCVEYSEDYHPLLNEINHCCEVIGNIYDNRDLLKESD